MCPPLALPSWPRLSCLAGSGVKTGTLPTSAAPSGPSLLLPPDPSANTRALYLRLPVSHPPTADFQIRCPFYPTSQSNLIIQTPYPTLLILFYCSPLLPSQKFFILIYLSSNLKYSSALSWHLLFPWLCAPSLHTISSCFPLPSPRCSPAGPMNLPTKPYLSSYTWQSLQKHKQ